MASLALSSLLLLLALIPAWLPTSGDVQARPENGGGIRISPDRGIPAAPPGGPAHDGTPLHRKPRDRAAMSPTVVLSKTEMTFRIPACSGITIVDDTVVVSNVGDEPVWMEFNVPATETFFLLSPTSPSTLEPGASQEFIVRYIQKGSLGSTGSLNFVFATNDIDPWSLDVKLRSVLDSVILTPSTRKLSFGTLLSCQPSSTLTVRLANDGPSTDTVTEVTLPAPFSAFPAPPYVIQPGKSMVVFVTFVPTIPGNYSGVLRYRGEPCGFTDSVVLEGSSVLPSYSLSDVNFGDATVGGNVKADAEVTNNNGSTIRVIAARVTPGLQEVTIDPAQFPLRIPPGGTRKIELAFAPTTLGNLSPGIFLEVDIDSICSATLTAPVAGAGIRGGVAPGRSELAFGDLLPCESAEDTLYIRNIGGAPVDLSAPVFDPADAASYFVVTTGMSSPGTLQPGDTHMIIVRFAPGPGADGPVNGALRFTSSDPLRPHLEIPLRGNRISQKLDLQGNDFQQTFVGLPLNVTRRLVNTGSAPIPVDDLTIAAPFSIISIVPPLPATLLPGDAIEVEMRFDPAVPGIYSDSLRVAAATPCDSFSFPIVGPAEDLVQATFHWGSVTGTPGELVRIPLLLDNDITRGAVTSFTAGGTFNPSILLPERIVMGELPSSDWSIADRTLGDGRVIFTARGTTPLAGPGTVAYLEARVMLGDSVATILGPGDSLSLYSQRTRVSFEPGIFSLEGYCDAGGARLLRADGDFGLKAIRPNPVRGVAEIAFGAVEDGPLQLLLFDALGRQVATVFDAAIAPGVYRIRLDAGELPSGAYHLELRTPTQRERMTVVVAK